MKESGKARPLIELRRDATIELLQTMIRNRCVNDGTEESGHEVRNVEVLETLLNEVGVDTERYEAAPGRVSLVARIEGSDPDAPSLCLNGHTDVVPVNEAGWDRDPFGGELVDGEVWGRGTIDMLNLTAAMAIVTRDLARAGFRPRGDLIFFAVADEESGSSYGARWMAENHPEVIASDFVLTENGGLHSGDPTAPRITINVGEKGVAWRRLRVRGTPGHGSMPYHSDNALMKAAVVVQRLGEYRSPARFHELWRNQVALLTDEHGLPKELHDRLVDPSAVDAAIDELGSAAPYLYSCCHMTLSPNVAVSPTKTNTIPDFVDIDVDIRTMPGESPSDVQAAIDTALEGTNIDVEVMPLMNDMASISPTDTPLWDALERAVQTHFPTAGLSPGLLVGFTDARVHRELGAVAYGAGLLSPSLSGAEFASRFHGNNERIDIESIELTAAMLHDTVTDLLG